MAEAMAVDVGAGGDISTASSKNSTTSHDLSKKDVPPFFKV
jgi:hypothetical protein